MEEKKGNLGRTRGYIKIFVLLLAGFLCFLIIGPEVNGIFKIDNTDKKSDGILHARVLFLSSYAYDWESVPRQLNGITKVLNGKAEINYLFMDTKKAEYNEVKNGIYKQIETNIRNDGKYDAVILGDDAALDFAIEYRKELFQDVPLVFEGINSEEKAITVAKDPLITGVVEQFPMEDTIGVACNLNPHAKRIVAISDDTESGKGSTEQFYDCQKSFHKLEFDDINVSKLSETEIAKQLSSYGEDTILLFLMFSNDKEGNHYTLLESIEMVSQYASTPVYKSDEIGIGYGLLGGTVISYEDMAATAADMVLSILKGEDVSDIPVSTIHKYNLFDQNIINKFHIDARLLPEKCTLLNRKETIFETYKVLVVTTITGIAILVFLLLWLTYENRKRKHLLEHIKETDEKLSMVVTVSGLYSWEFNLDKKEVICDAHFQKNFKCERIVKDFPECLLRKNVIAEESMQDFRELYNQLKKGIKEITRDICVNHWDGSGKEWLRVTYVRISHEKDDNRAIATAINVTEQHDIYEKYENALAIHTTKENDVEVSMSMDITDNVLIDYDYSIEPFLYFKSGDSIENE